MSTSTGTSTADSSDPRWTRFDELVTAGWPEADAYAEAFALDRAQVRRDDAAARLRADGYQGSRFDELARAAYKDELRRQILLAEAATCGVMVTAEARQRGVVPWDLWDYQESFARKWASEELKDWWDEHGRLTFAAFKEQLLNGRGTPGRDVWQRAS